ncbi:UNVERIFIED_CONTAM: hypothetical protein FKN15_064573 [Acipenser sinensis]
MVTDVPDLFLTAVKLTHDNTGARYLHVARDDSNNLFSVQFRTTPMDSTGVPHILEHTVLCGSEKYPCRDPFFKMLNRSLSTFMNAFTASDYTMYPFSTQNGKDFQNLLSVYLDAVFFPCLRELDFWQEGWRLEHENPTDPNAPLVFKGVVFNEMKGAFTDNERLYAQHLQNKLYPDHTYSVVSGGEPLDIPELSWEQLKQFHATHYHPSNTRFFTYGDLPLEQHLKQIQEEALSRFQRTEPQTAVPPQTHWSNPREHHVTCGPDSLAPDPSKQNTVCVSYLLGDFDGSTKEASFSVGLQGIAEKDIETVKEIIFQTVNEIIANGFEEERIEALLHKIEIQMKHQSTSFGLSLASYIATCWNHDGDPVEVLKISDKVTRFRQCLQDNPHFLQEKVKLYFKDNPHRLTLSMSPDESYFEKQAKAEEEKLKQKLMAAQSATQDASCLPALKVSDIQPTIPFTPVEMGNAGDVPVQYCAQPTNGMVYFRAMCSLNTLPEDLKIYVPLFCNVITKLGCGVMDYRQQSQQIELKTGGMSVSPQIIPDATDLDMYEQGVLLTSSSLERNVPDMMRLWSEIINTACFDDEERLRVLVMMSAQELSNGIPDSGHTYAMIRAARNLTPAGDLQETFDGMDQVKLMKRIAEMSNLTPILRKFPRIKKHLFNPENMRLGCGVMDYRQQSQQIELKTGGMSVSPQIIPDATDLDMYEQGVLLTSSSLERNVPDMMRLWSEIINTACFDDEERLRVLVMMSAQELANGIPDSGHTYAMIRAARNLTPAGDLQETFDGMDQVKLMKRIAEMSNLTPILRKFPRIKKHLFNPENMRCAVNATPQMMSEASLEVEKLMNLIARKKKERKHVRPNIIEVSVLNLPKVLYYVTYLSMHILFVKSIYLAETYMIYRTVYNLFSEPGLAPYICYTSIAVKLRPMRLYVYCSCRVGTIIDYRDIIDIHLLQ